MANVLMRLLGEMEEGAIYSAHELSSRLSLSTGLTEDMLGRLEQLGYVSRSARCGRSCAGCGGWRINNG